MIYGYIRVSANKQTVENQKYEIKNYAKQNKFKVNRWIEETISGMIKLEKRKLGRGYGCKNKRYMLDDRKQEVIRLLNEKRTKRYIARYFGASTTTLYNFMARHNL